MLSITAFAVAQTEVPKRLAVVTFSEDTFKGSVQFAGTTEERIIPDDGRKVIGLGDVLVRLERMYSEGWEIIDLEVTEFGSISNGNSMGHGAYYTWLLTRSGQ